MGLELYQQNLPGLETCERSAAITPASPRAERVLGGLALALGARDVPGWSSEEEGFANAFVAPAPAAVERLRASVVEGQDPLGDQFCAVRSAEERRGRGATYTPDGIVRALSDWAAAHVPAKEVARVVDPGVGSARFLRACAGRFPNAELVGVEVDPLAATIARGNLAALGLQDRARVVLADYRALMLDDSHGRTLFIGNPPYVRHHQIAPEWKRWLTEAARRRHLSASQLAGLHVHFFLATALHARNGDLGAFVTAAEWLDVNYGKLVRQLFLGSLGGLAISVIEPEAMPFPDAATTAAVTTFEVGTRSASVLLRRISTREGLQDLSGGSLVGRDRLEAASRWSSLTEALHEKREGYVELGELCRVHRGQVTGANRVWIANPGSVDLPERFRYRSVTRAQELFRAGRQLADAGDLREVIDLPVDLDSLPPEERRRIDRFLVHARALGADSGYVASARKAWWSVGLRQPAPILATYMARRTPAFVRNLANARHINIAHGLYPRVPLGERALLGLIEYLSTAVKVAEGRTYAGGLTKFEPREMERILVPEPRLLEATDR